ncbi:MAG TPA: universal stress protein [Jiangellales bacterium]|nr:universal stress protein [Jiangellales bacterium]
MIERILVAADDSPGGLAAVRAAVAIAASEGARLLAVHVLVDGVLDRELSALGRESDVSARRGLGTTAVLAHVARLASRQGVTVETVSRSGEPAPCILAEARSWRPDLIVVARAARHTTGHPYVGSQTRHVLEFAEQPVLVVPQPRR